MVNEREPGQMNVHELIEALQDEDPDAIVVWVDRWNSSLNILCAIERVEGTGLVVKLHGKNLADMDISFT